MQATNEAPVHRPSPEGPKGSGCTAREDRRLLYHAGTKLLDFREFSGSFQGVVVETYTLDPRSSTIGRIFSANPLIRRSDRIEAVITCAAVVVFLLVIPLASIVAAVVYEARHSHYVQEAKDRHQVVASVAPAGAEALDPALVQASWPGSDGEQTAYVRVTDSVKAGDHVQIWVNQSGNAVTAPTAPWHAVVDAIAALEAILLISGLGMTGFVNGVRAHLDLVRDAEWEHDIRCLEEDEGRTNLR